jgi:hypothetical protein
VSHLACYIGWVGEGGSKKKDGEPKFLENGEAICELARDDAASLCRASGREDLWMRKGGAFVRAYRPEGSLRADFPFCASFCPFDQLSLRIQPTLLSGPTSPNSPSVDTFESFTDPPQLPRRTTPRTLPPSVISKILCLACLPLTLRLSLVLPP